MFVTSLSQSLKISQARLKKICTLTAIVSNRGSNSNNCEMALLIRNISRKLGLRVTSSAPGQLSSRSVSTNQSYAENDERLHPFAQLPETHEMLRKTCRDYAESVLKPIAGEVDQKHMYPEKQV